MKNFRLSVTLALLALLTLTFTSCEKDSDDPSPEYVGTWIMEDDTYEFAGLTYVSTLKLTTSSFDYDFSVSSGGFSATEFAMKGGLSVTGDQFTISVTSIGEVNDLGGMDWVNKGDDGWAELLVDMEMEETQTVSFIVEGNTLTMDPDGDYPEVYTKK